MQSNWKSSRSVREAASNRKWKRAEEPHLKLPTDPTHLYAYMCKWSLIQLNRHSGRQRTRGKEREGRREEEKERERKRDRHTESKAYNVS